MGLPAAPVTLSAEHETGNFDCGVPSLNAWLRHRAAANQSSGASRTYVACEGTRVIGYCALASGAIAASGATGRFRRNMPDPIPVVVLGRLAVASAYDGRGFGVGLFQDAVLRVLQAGDTIGIRGMLVHALSQEAKAFYQRLGLSESPLDPMTLMVSLVDLRDALNHSTGP